MTRAHKAGANAQVNASRLPENNEPLEDGISGELFHRFAQVYGAARENKTWRIALDATKVDGRAAQRKVESDVRAYIDKRDPGMKVSFTLEIPEHDGPPGGGIVPPRY